jgi:hypothetical protein
MLSFMYEREVLRAARLERRHNSPELGVESTLTILQFVVPTHADPAAVVAMNDDDISACCVLLIDDEPFAEDIIAHGLKGCAPHVLRYARDPGMAVALA